MDELAGATVKGYVLAERIGEGGFGVVYRAHQSSVGRDVAVKVVLPTLASRPEFIRRFEIEAQLIARLEHPHITPLYDYWRDPDGAFLVMRYFPQGSLRDALARDAWSVERAAQLLDELASALAHAHRNGVVHRDIKPSNVLLDGDGRAYLTDFGIAKSLADRAREQLTNTGAVIGSPDYLAPEQARGSAVAHTSDIYSLGVLMHEVLQGHHPFPDSTPIERMIKHLNESLPPVRDLSGEHADAVNAVLQRATAKSPSERYDSALVMAADFRAAIGHVEVTARGAGVPDLARVGGGAELAVGAAPASDGVIENPYKGLRAFRAADADHFSGREELVDKLVDRMSGEESVARMLALVGPSGSGKSSVLHAGLVPALRGGAVPGSDQWYVIDMVPGAHPFDELEVALMRIAVRNSPTLHEQLVRDDRGLVRAAQILLPDDESDLLIVIDQFEELFTLVEDEQVRRRFLSSIVNAVTNPRSRVRILLTLRADFYDRPLQYAGFADVLAERVETIVPMSAEELEHAIVTPAEAQGIGFEDGLVTRIVSEVHEQPGALPLLQYALTQLFDAREGRVLTKAAYDRIGGVGGALGKRAEEVFQSYAPQAQEWVRQMFLRLVALGEGTEDTRRRTTREELRAVAMDAAQMDGIVDRYASDRLLTLDHDPATREPIVELAHEAILREWTRLGRWLDESRSNLRMQRQLAGLEEEWRRSGSDPSFLLRGTRLAQFEGWQEGSDVALTPREHAFLQASLDLRAHEEAEERARQERAAMLQRRSQRFLQALVGVLLVAAVVSGGLGLWANQQRLTAEQQRELAQEQQQVAESERSRAAAAERDAREQAGILLAAQAESQAKQGNTDRAILLALEAVENFPRTPQAERALGNSVSANHAIGWYDAHELGLTSVSWSPDGTRVATSSQDNTVRVWNPFDGTTQLVLEHPEGISRNVLDFTLATAWSPDGRWLYVLAGDRYLTGSQDHHLFRWDARSGDLLDDVEVANSADPEAGRGNTASMVKYRTVSGLDVDPHTGRIATLGGDNTALVWPGELGEPTLVIAGHEDDVNGVAWSPDGAWLATVSLDGTARVWHGQTGEPVAMFAEHGAPVQALAWHAESDRLATAGDDGAVRVWDAATGNQLARIDAPLGIASTLAWHPDGERILVAVGDTRLRMFHAETGAVEHVFGGHEKELVAIRWAPDGQHFVTASMDATARLWTREPVNLVDRFPGPSVDNPEWSADGRYLSMPSLEAPGRVMVWDADQQEIIIDHVLAPEEHDAYMEGAWAPDAHRMVVLSMESFPESFSLGSPARIVDAFSGDVLHVLTPTDDTWVRGVDWSPDGRRVATVTFRGAVDLWDPDTGELVATAVHGDHAFTNHPKFSPDGTVLATAGDDGFLRIWDVETMEEVDQMVLENASAMWEVAWSPDGSTLLTSTGGGEGFLGTTGGIEVWDFERGELQQRIFGHAGDVNSVTWSPTGNRFATLGSDNTARVWDARSYEELLRLPAHVDFNAGIEWSPRGDLLAIGANGRPLARVVHVWNSLDELVDYARECCVFRELTDAERQEFGLDLVQSSTSE